LHIICAADFIFYDNVGEEFEGAAVIVTVPLGCLKSEDTLSRQLSLPGRLKLSRSWALATSTRLVGAKSSSGKNLLLHAFFKPSSCLLTLLPELQTLL